jgi:anti-sigma factor ChrR (cupin superfamily)
METFPVSPSGYRLLRMPSFAKERSVVTNHIVSGYHFNNANNVAWRKSAFAAGIEVKDLGTADGRSMQLVRFTPGASFPLHRHEGPEFIYLLEGVAIQEGQHLSAGWAAVAAMGTTDSNFHSPDGCVFLTVYTD